MFRCEMCHKAKNTYEKPVRVVTKTETIEHPQREDKRHPSGFDNGGMGTRIVEEKNVCAACVLETVG